MKLYELIKILDGNPKLCAHIEFMGTEFETRFRSSEKNEIQDLTIDSMIVNDETLHVWLKPHQEENQNENQ